MVESKGVMHCCAFTFPKPCQVGGMQQAGSSKSEVRGGLEFQWWRARVQFTVAL